jgi:NADH-quinone oxidoreductase subunit M
MLKMGTYGLVRFNLAMFPKESIQFAPVIGVLAVIGIIYGAWVCYAQTDVKKLVAYSSVSHLGFVVLGIFALNAQGIQGGTLQMINHGISTGGLFLIVGILYERYHTKDMAAYGGIWSKAPALGAIALVVSLSSMGLPGLNGFVGEFTILLGSVGSKYLGFFFTLFATLGVIMAAVYILYMFQRVFMGDWKAPAHGHADGNDEHATGHAALTHDDHGHDAHDDGSSVLKLKWNEWAVLIPIIIMIFWLGLRPGGFFAVMDKATNQLVARVESANNTTVADVQAEADALALQPTAVATEESN